MNHPEIYLEWQRKNKEKPQSRYRIWGSRNSGYEEIVVWDMTPCSPLKINRHFGRTYRLHLQYRRIRLGRNQSLLATCFHSCLLLVLFFDIEDGGDMFFLNVGWFSTDYTASYPRSITLRIAGVEAVIRTKNLSNTSLERYYQSDRWEEMTEVETCCDNAERSMWPLDCRKTGSIYSSSCWRSRVYVWSSQHVLRGIRAFISIHMRKYECESGNGKPNFTFIRHFPGFWSRRHVFDSSSDEMGFIGQWLINLTYQIIRKFIHLFRRCCYTTDRRTDTISTQRGSFLLLFYKQHPKRNSKYR
jgi:hypothetical protein